MKKHRSTTADKVKVRKYAKLQKGLRESNALTDNKLLIPGILMLGRTGGKRLAQVFESGVQMGKNMSKRRGKRGARGLITRSLSNHTYVRRAVPIAIAMNQSTGFTNSTHHTPPATTGTPAWGRTTANKGPVRPRAQEDTL